MFSTQGDVTFDVFAHLWNFDTSPKVTNISGNQRISDDEMDDLLAVLQPTRAIIEDESFVPSLLVEEMADAKRPHYRQKENITGVWTASQFYGMMKVANLKRSHEIENNFTYDACVRCRTDIVMDADCPSDWVIPKPNILYAVHCGWDEGWNAYRVGDMLFYADSLTYDKITSMYRFMPCITDDSFGYRYAPPEFALFQYAKMINIGIYALMDDPKIRRTEEYAARLANEHRKMGNHEVI